MRAVIMLHPVSPSSALLPIAGQPLLARQLEWLRAQGVDQIALEVSVVDAEVTTWLDQNPALTDKVVRVPTRRYSSPEDIAARAGFPASAPCVVMFGDLLAQFDLAALVAEHGSGARHVSLRGRGDLLPGMLRMIGTGASFEVVQRPVDWGCFVLNRRDALELSAMVLRGCTSDMQVPAAEGAPGVWCARGADIERGAIVRPGVLLGPGVVICAGAVVGPDVVIGAGTVVEAGADLSNVVVDAGLIVGAITVRDGRLSSIGIHHLQSDELMHEVTDDRIVTTRRLLRRAA